MRVIGKGGEYDIPYELSVFWRDENIIWANAFGTGKIIVAQYSSMEKAEKAMQKLHECYTGVILLQNVSFPDDAAEQLKSAKNGFICVNNRTDNVRIEPMHMVFRFPKEGEI